MTTPRDACRVTATIPRDASDPILTRLMDLGVVSGHLAAGRSLTLEEKRGILGVGARTVTIDDPVETLSFLVTPEHEAAALGAIATAARLDIPGRGSAYSEDVAILRCHDLCRENAADARVGGENTSLLTEIMGICCIVQRGQGDAVARMALDTGTCVPAVTFGNGTGLRDKLGLLRITIPAEKEIIHLVASVHDADIVMDLMVEAGRLDQPGKGFIYLFPLRSGIVDTRIMRGMPRHAASIEQIISALDQLEGGTQWRSRSGLGGGDGRKERRYLSSLVGLVLICNEGRGDTLVQAAMAAGAAGATVSRLKHIRPAGTPLAKVSPAREMSEMIVAEQQVPAIVDALDEAGAFDSDTFGLLYSRAVPKACTYLSG